MPLYEYECSCGHSEERIVNLGDINKRYKCENCGKLLKRIVSLSSFALKGSGWYATDYKNKPKTPKQEK